MEEAGELLKNKNVYRYFLCKVIGTGEESNRYRPDIVDDYPYANWSVIYYPEEPPYECCLVRISLQGVDFNSVLDGIENRINRVVERIKEIKALTKEELDERKVKFEGTKDVETEELRGRKIKLREGQLLEFKKQKEAIMQDMVKEVPVPNAKEIISSSDWQELKKYGFTRERWNGDSNKVS